MKKKCPLLFFLFLIQLFSKAENTKFNVEDLLSSESTSGETNSVDLDPDDMMLKMKTFFDNYANKIKQNTKGVDKIILPIDDKNMSIIYVNNFDFDEFKRKTQNFVEDSIKFREDDLKNFREDKQMVEEKYIDLITNKKILDSRSNIGDGEKNKLLNDFNEKNNLKTSIETEVKDSIFKSEHFSVDNLKKLNDIRDKMKNFDKKITELTLNKEVFEHDIEIRNSLEELRTQIFSAEFESEFLGKLNKTKIDFIQKANDINKIFQSAIQQTSEKIRQIQMRMKDKKKISKKLQHEIELKLESFDNLNKTFHKLKTFENNYENSLRENEESLNLMKSKKKIILENIEEKKKQRSIRKQTIESVLRNLEKELDKFNVDKISVNKYRKDITNINNRLRNLLVKENMIFKKNKIKI